MKLGILIPCPNCESAWTGGHPQPETLEKCMVCGDPKKKGEITGYVWRWPFMQNGRTEKNLEAMGLMK